MRVDSRELGGLEIAMDGVGYVLVERRGLYLWIAGAVRILYA